MKKALLLIFFWILSLSLSFAQNLELMKKDGSSIMNDSITISTSNDSSTIAVPLYVKNNSSKSMDVMVKVYVKERVSGSSASYCWGASCYDIATTQPDAFTTIAASDTAKEFHSDYEPNKNTGITECMFTFYNKGNSDDSISITIYYEVVATGIENNLSEMKQNINAYPNPVQNTLYINHNIQNKQKGTITIYDIVGKKIKAQRINMIEETTSVDVSNLKSGIYIWTFEIDGIPIKSEKILKR